MSKVLAKAILTDLPVELIQHILSFLPNHDAFNAICVSPYVTMPRCDLQQRRWKQLGLIHLAAEGDLAGVKYLYLHKYLYLQRIQTTKGDDLSSLKYDNYYTIAAQWACDNGHVAVVKFLYEVAGAKIDEWNWQIAVTSGHFAMIEYLHRGLGFCSLSKSVIYNLCFRGCTDIVTFLHHQQLWPVGQYFAMDFASWKGHLPLVKLLHNIGEVCSSNALNSAALAGHLDVVQFLHSIGASYTIEALDGALYNNRLAVVQFLNTLF